MFKLCPIFPLPLYLVATGLLTIQFLLNSAKTQELSSFWLAQRCQRKKEFVSLSTSSAAPSAALEAWRIRPLLNSADIYKVGECLPKTNNFALRLRYTGRKSYNRKSCVKMQNNNLATLKLSQKVQMSNKRMFMARAPTAADLRFCQRREREEGKNTLILQLRISTKRSRTLRESI
jgi:hypothetical protein